ncbi:MAG: ACP S-malonyltransferase, partial [Proteobacteria bacterium]|nr:ACP S-malonyltransferase [Pseudomonadota bacterium]
MATSPILFVFPGQGSQYIGIGKDLFDTFESVRQLYGQASEALGYDLAQLSFEDPEGKINLTRYTQPVLLTHSISCLQAFQEVTNGKVRAGLAAGHSLGEYSALVAAGALDFLSALQLVKARGQLMGDLGDGEMEALPLPIESAQELAEQHYCAIAACNLPEQTVVGGRAEDLDALVNDLQERYPGKRTARLKTEGAFHTFYMIEAALQF